MNIPLFVRQYGILLTNRGMFTAEKETLARLLAQTKKVISGNKEGYNAELAQLRDKHAETEDKIRRLVDSLSVATDTSAKYVMEQIDALHRRSEQEQSRLSELEALTEQSRMLHQEFAFHQEMIESFAHAVDSATIEEKRRLLLTIVKEVVWDGKNAYVYLFDEDGEAELLPVKAAYVSVRRGQRSHATVRGGRRAEAGGGSLFDEKYGRVPRKGGIYSRKCVLCCAAALWRCFCAGECRTAGAASQGQPGGRPAGGYAAAALQPRRHAGEAERYRHIAAQRLGRGGEQRGGLRLRLPFQRDHAVADQLLCLLACFERRRAGHNARLVAGQQRFFESQRAVNGLHALFAFGGLENQPDAAGKDLGGADAEIVVIGREAGSGTRDGFESITSTKEACKYRQELTSTGDVITTVANNPNAIGYASLAALQDSVKALTVGGVAPSEATVKDGSYVIQRPFVLVTKTGTQLSEVAQKFFDFATSAEANDLISKAGAVPVK